MTGEASSVASTAPTSAAHRRAGRPQSAARRAAGIISIRFAAVMVLGLASILTARSLNPVGRGTYGLVITVSWIAAALGHLSIEQANILRWQRGDDRRAIASTSFLLGVLGGSAAAVVGWVAVNYLGAGSFSTHDRWLIALVLPIVPLNILSGYLIGLHILSDRLARVNVVRLITASWQLVVLVVLWRTSHLNVTAALVVWIATLAVGPVLLLFPGLSIQPRYVSRKLAVSLLCTALKYHLGMAALFLLRRVDIVMLNALASRRDVGLYVVAVLLAELLFLPTESIAQLVQPRQVTGTLEEAAAYTARVIRVNTIVGLTAALVLAGASPFIIRLAFGADYMGSVAPLLALLPGVVAIGLVRPITAILVRLDRPFVVSVICVAALVLNVALNLVLIPALGVVGASIASSVAYAAQAFAYGHWLLRRTPLRLSELRPTRDDLALFPALIRRTPAEIPVAP
jgi:O-antigen/teichoic acid export membrane protein